MHRSDLKCPLLHEWDEQYLLSLIQHEVQENIHLDYKACDALNSKADAKKGELSKDVSAFANSDGGIIIYGMIEGKGDKKHLPEKLDTGFYPGNISKEWIESVINSNIQRRISGIKIHLIELKLRILVSFVMQLKSLKVTKLHIKLQTNAITSVLTLNHVLWRNMKLEM